MEPYKLHVKIGSHEFQGEGAEESVRRDFEDWIKLIGTVPSKPLAPIPETPASPVNGTIESPDIDQLVLSKVFITDPKSDHVSLRIQPQTGEKESDSIVLILLGHKYLKHQEEVAVTQLKAAMIQSGFRVARVDRMAVRPVGQGFVHKGGAGKGGRYSLTNTGIEKGKNLLSALASA
jgi:hypothetical protein